MQIQKKKIIFDRSFIDNTDFCPCKPVNAVKDKERVAAAASDCEEIFSDNALADGKIFDKSNNNSNDKSKTKKIKLQQKNKMS